MESPRNEPECRAEGATKVQRRVRTGARVVIANTGASGNSPSRRANQPSTRQILARRDGNCELLDGRPSVAMIGGHRVCEQHWRLTEEILATALARGAR